MERDNMAKITKGSIREEILGLWSDVEKRMNIDLSNGKVYYVQGENQQLALAKIQYILDRMPTKLGKVSATDFYTVTGNKKGIKRVHKERLVAHLFSKMSKIKKEERLLLERKKYVLTRVEKTSTGSIIVKIEITKYREDLQDYKEEWLGKIIRLGNKAVQVIEPIDCNKGNAFIQKRVGSIVSSLREEGIPVEEVRVTKLGQERVLKAENIGGISAGNTEKKLAEIVASKIGCGNLE